jgi:hypothetical protein
MADTSPLSEAIIKCQTCRFWHGQDARAGVCRRYAPLAGDTPFDVARWPETRSGDGCGEGSGATVDDPARLTCGTCRFWDRPGIGIDPARRGDHLQAWWQQAGWCRRHAPRPGIAIGEHAFWRVTHASDHCFEGRPKPGADGV